MIWQEMQTREGITVDVTLQYKRQPLKRAGSVCGVCKKVPLI